MESKTDAPFFVSQNFQDLLLKNHIGFWEIDFRTSEIQFDLGIRQLYELDPSYVKATLTNWYGLVHPEEVQRLMEMMAAVSADKIEYDTTFRICTPNGRVKYVQASGTKIKDSSGQVIKLIGLNWDMTEAKTYQKLLIEQSKMASLGEVTSGMAHEINNPLSIVKGRATLLKEKIKNKNVSEEKLLSDLEAIEKNAARIEKIIQSLNSFSRRHSNSPSEKVSVLKIAEEAFEILKDKLTKEGIKFSINAQDGLDHNQTVMAKSAEIIQALINLLNNSYEAIKNLKEKWIKIDLRDHGNRVEIAVIDSGSGIHPDVASRMMEPFFTTKPTGQAHGLGLSIAVQLLQAHEAQLEYVPTGPHTEFVISFKKL